MGIPTLMIEADMVDERNFSEGQVETRIEAFIEVLSGRR
ncbi:MAG: 2-hydroxyacyl-CoA dehydratase family protein [Syntrophales bacterium]|jgi:benzoyl-CoA reductase/2-hydroxyglutaryl-CoA dehydratase subunit BcrC/BadD/HgdB|nr:2-hydroxyacyl-CoA dehydratase family protein [Syntrophales bacterium]